MHNNNSVVHIFISMIEVRRTTRSWKYSRPLYFQLLVGGLASIKEMRMWKKKKEKTRQVRIYFFIFILDRLFWNLRHPLQNISFMNK